MRPCAVSFIYPALCRLCSVPRAHDTRPTAFKHSLKCGIAGSVNFRKCRISARASQRARKREVSSGAHVYGRVFEENSKLKALRYFSGAFKPSFPEIDFYLKRPDVEFFEKRIPLQFFDFRFRETGHPLYKIDRATFSLHQLCRLSCFLI